MRKFNGACLAILIAISTSLSFITGCTQKSNRETKENDMYDGPDKAIEFEIERTKDPATGKVPWQKLRIAIEQTEQAKDQLRNNRPEAIQTLSWIERGPNGDFSRISGNPRPNDDQTSGRIRAVMVDSLDPTHRTVFAGSVAGGLWKTTDITVNPANWTPVNDFLSNLAIAYLCQDPRPGFQNIMYMCTGESYSNSDAVRGVGVFKSIDAGANWTFLSSTSNYTSCTRILCDYLGNVYLGARSFGLLRSTDGGTSWTDITPSGIGTSVCDLEISSTAVPARLHVTTGIFSASGYRYTDIPATVTSGSGWNSATTPFTTFNQRTEFAVSGNVLYACPDNSAHQVPTIWKSIDGGDNWAGVPIQPAGNWANGQGWYDISCGINPANSNECIVGGLECYKTTTGGTTAWTKIAVWVGSSGQYIHADQHDVQWWDGGTKLMFACDGGIHYSSDGGATVRDRNKGLRIKQFYSVAIHPTDVNNFIAGAQDNGMHRLNHPGLDSSIEFYGGDGMYAAIDQDEPQFQFGAAFNNNIRRTTNGGVSWGSVSFSGGRFVSPWDYDNTGNIMYLCNTGGSYLRWNNPQGGAVSSNIVSVAEFTGGNVSAVHVSPYTANRVFFGTGVGGIIMVDNANVGTTATGTIITPSGAAGYANCVVTGSSDQNLMAVYSSYGVTQVWVSTNGGTTWLACDGNLPDMPVRWALFHPDTDTKAFIATETGVWETDLLNGASTIWNPNTSFPNVSTHMIKYRASDRTIAAGTHGRGIWTATIPPPISFNFNSPSASVSSCPAPATMAITLGTISNGGFSNPITLSATAGVPAGTNVTFGTNPVTPGNSSVVTLNNTNTLSFGSYVITITGVASGAPNQTVNLTYTINAGAGPVISVQPASQTVCEGSNAVFSVTAAGVTSYQWQLSTDGGATYNNIGGATASSYTAVAVTAAMNNYRYRVIVTGACGSTTSSTAILTVQTAPAITNQPQSATLCAGSNNTFSVTATGTNLTYQWESSTNGCAGPFTTIVGATSNSYTITGITAGMNNTGYRCIVSGTCTPAVISSCALLTVVTSVVITTQPLDQTVCEGGNASFTVAGSGPGVLYQWQLSTDGGANYNNIAGATNATLNLTGVTALMGGYRYRAILSNATCTTASTSNAAILTVQTLPAITSHPQSVTLCVGSNNTFGVTATGTNITYQWQVSIDGGVTYNNIAGATSVNYLLSGITAGMDGNRYRCVVSGTCTPPATSNAAILTVISPVTITSQPSNVTVCATGSTSFTVVGSSTVAIIYQWQVSTDGGVTYNNIPGANSATLNLTSVTVVMNNNRYRLLLSNATCTTPTISNAVILTVNALPVVTWANALPGRCVSATTFTLTGGTPLGGTYSGAGVTGTNFNAATAGLGPHVLTYTYTDANGCTNTATNSINVVPLPIVTLAASPYTRLFPGLTTTLTATTVPTSGFTLTWFKNGTILTGVTGNTLVVSLTGPNASTTGLGDYRVDIADGNGCNNQSQVVTIADSASSKLFIFPSPNDGQFTVAYFNPGGSSTRQTIAVYDSHGAQVYYGKLVVSVPYQLHNIDLRPAARGIYYVVVGDASGKKLADGKVMVQ